MRIKNIDLRHLTPAKAKRAVTRLYNFKKRSNLKITYSFKLPEKDKTKKNKSRDKKKCPYCTSPLTLQNDFDSVCSNLNMLPIVEELKSAKIKYGSKAELFISTKASRYYYEFLEDGDKLICDYKLKSEESKFVN